jgi:hypothetical protein
MSQPRYAVSHIVPPLIKCRRVPPPVLVGEGGHDNNVREFGFPQIKPVRDAEMLDAAGASILAAQGFEVGVGSVDATTAQVVTPPLKPPVVGICMDILFVMLKAKLWSAAQVLSDVTATRSGAAAPFLVVNVIFLAP